ncbi:MAG: 50S ribosomal protein L37 [Candidatus Methylarchaceae archaeon HK02M2]|nr:50S ribosomal protein L37 [Candidatus Methylarchaceae archaeon HK02M2]
MRKGKRKGLKGLGTKYGSSLRKKYGRIYTTLKLKRMCPSCGAWKLKRKSLGIWQCRSCGFTMAGRAYDVTPIKIS